MRAIIVVDGGGVQLRPFRTPLPKPLVPIADELPIMEVVLQRLANQGVRHVSIATRHLPHLVRSVIGDSPRGDMKVDHWEPPRGSGRFASILEHLRELPERFLVTNTFLLSDLDVRDVVATHAKVGSPFTLTTMRRIRQRTGNLVFSDEHGVSDIQANVPVEDTVDAGTYVMEREVLEDIVAEHGPLAAVDAGPLTRTLRNNGSQTRVHHYRGWARDIRLPEEYEMANAEFTVRRAELLAPSNEVIELIPRHAEMALIPERAAI